MFQQMVDEPTKNLSTIEGTIATVRWTDEESGSAIFTVDVDDNPKNRVTAVGKVYQPIPGEQIVLHGEYVRHQHWGDQLQVHTYDKPLPTAEKGIVAYLASDLFKGIGEKTAKKIYDTLGEHCIEQIISDPTVLHKIPRMKKKAEMVAKQLEDHQSLQGAFTFLYNYGIATHLAMKLYKAYGSMLADIVIKNPYRMILDVRGISFKTADKIAKNTQAGLTSSERVQAAIVHVLREASDKEGHVFYPVRETAEKVKELITDLPLSAKGFKIALARLVNRDRVIMEMFAGNAILYLPDNYEAEQNLARHIVRLSLAHRRKVDPGHTDLHKLVESIARELKMPYDIDQKSAIVNFFHASVSVLTGGPGMGKTTVLKGVIRAIERIMGDNPSILICTPTGRAASRVYEATGYEAMTVHFALKLDPGTGHAEYDERNPLPYDVFILDEASMLGIRDASKLFAAIPSGALVLIVGDIDQLPSVQTGAVLRDLISSGVLPTTQLKTIHRTAADSPIPHNAYQIRTGGRPQNHAPNFVMRKVDQDTVTKLVMMAVDYEVSKGRKIEDIMVLSPMYDGPGGVHQMNKLIQAKYNPRPANGPEWIINKKRDERIWRNTRVMMVNKNDRRLGVMNGEIGTVVKVVPPNPNSEDEQEQAGYVLIKFGARIVRFEPPNIKYLTLAYSASIHKMQGSELPVIIHVLLMRHFNLLFRSLLYTGVTRASERVYLFSEPKALHIAIQTVKEYKRYSRLSMLLKMKLGRRTMPQKPA